MNSNFPDSERTIRCAGFPYVGERKLLDDEQRSLHRKIRLNLCAGCLVSCMVPIFAISIAVYLGELIQRERQDLIGLAIAVLIPVTLITCAIAILRGTELLSVFRKLWKTCRKGYVRQFEGPFQWYDPTDIAFDTLVKESLLDPIPSASVSIELFPHIDEIYAINGMAIKKAVRLTVTTAASRPLDAPTWDLPESCLLDCPTANLERRRPSEEESYELSTYTRQPMRYWAARFAIGVLFIPVTIYGLVIPLLAIFAIWKLISAPGIDLLKHEHVIVVFAVIVTIGMTGLRIYRDHSFCRAIRHDIEFGWIFVFSPLPTEKVYEEIEGANVTIERLPVSEALWTIDGKPAGWRCLPKEKSKRSYTFRR
ncbi:MAG: hypothetical protein SGI88_07265 [Candidatus Hydrogenedentes bacterium]|nr:hypothetical protein [Candidatus Hydrogenedentota bacterium]